MGVIHICLRADVQLGDMPDAAMLKTIKLKQFDSRALADRVASAAAAEILSQLGGSATPTGEPGKVGVKLVPTGPGLPALPKRLVDKISAGQYVDFSELPPAKGRIHSLPN